MGTISDRNPILASEISDPTGVHFGLDKPGDDSYRISASEMKKLLTGYADVKSFGAAGTGLVDDTASILNALQSGPAYLPPGDFLVEDLNFTTDQDVHLTGPGRLLVAANTNGLNISLPMGSLITPSAIASVDVSTQANSPKVTEVTATGHGLVAGDVVKVVADKTYADLRSVVAVVGELATVETVVDANTFRLNKELEDIASGDTGIVLRKLSSKRIDISVRVHLTGSQAVQSGTPYCVRVANVINPKVRVDCERSHQTILLVENCLGGTADVTAQWADDDEANGVFGYGLRIGGGTSSLVGTINGSQMRHACTSKDANGTAYDTSEARMAELGRSREVTIKDSTVFGCRSSAFDTHANAERWLFSSCKAIWNGIVDPDSGYLPVGFQVRGRDMTYDDCESVGGRTGFSDVSPSAHNGSWRTDYLGCRAFQSRLRGIHIDQAGMVGTDKHHVRISGGVYEARSACMTIEDSYCDIDNVEFRYYGFASPITMAQTTAPLHVRFNNVLFNHTTDNDVASVQLTSGTATVQVLDAFTQLVADLGTDGLFEAEAGTTLDLYFRNWQWTAGRTHQGMTSGTGTIAVQGSGKDIHGSGSPSGSVSAYWIGQWYFDAVAKAWYRSTGLANTDWQAL